MNSLCLLASLLSTLPTAAPDPGYARQSCITSAGDLNGDGIGDLWVAGRWQDDHGYPARGHIWGLSGSDGTALVEIHSTERVQEFGRSLASTGDVNADGIPDLVLGKGNTEGGKGAIEVRSGKDGALILLVTSPRKNDVFGFAVGGGVDVDQDGVPDIVVSAPQQTPCMSGATPKKNSRTYLVSGKTGEFIQAGVEAVGERPNYFEGGSCAAIIPDLSGGSDHLVLAGTRGYSTRSGELRYTVETGNWSAGAMGDVNSDGINDFFITSVNTEAAIRSGADGTLLQQLSYRGGYYRGEAMSAANLGDVDLDGVGDLAIGTNEGPSISDCDTGGAGAVSGRTGKTLFGRVAAQHDGFDVSAIGDVNGDRRNEIALCSRRTQIVEVFSLDREEPLWRVEVAKLLEEKADDE